MEGRLIVGMIVAAVSVAACGAAQAPAAGRAVQVPSNTTTTGVAVTGPLPTAPSIDPYCVLPTTTTHAPNQAPLPGPPFLFR
jgi:hypothetical protein